MVTRRIDDGTQYEDRNLQEFECSINEIAESEGVKKQAVVKIIDGALNKIRKEAKRRGLDEYLEK